MTDVMIEKLKQLRDIRAYIMQKRIERDDLLKSVTESKEFISIAESLDTSAKIEKQLYDFISEAAEREGLLTDNEHPFPGVEIKWRKTFRYDIDSALQYAIHNMTGVLTVDTKRFEKAIDAGVVPEEIGAMEMRPKAYIAQDLFKFFPEEEK